MPDKKMAFAKPVPKKTFGIGSKYMDSQGSDSSEADGGSSDTRKLEAGKLLLRAIDRKDPELVAEAISTLVECCSGDGDGPDAESESEDLGEKD